MPLAPDMPSMPDDLRMAAEASDSELEMSLAGLIPTPDKPYSPKVVTALDHLRHQEQTAGIVLLQ
jgi:hypothetical protein